MLTQFAPSAPTGSLDPIGKRNGDEDRDENLTVLIPPLKSEPRCLSALNTQRLY